LGEQVPEEGDDLRILPTWSYKGYNKTRHYEYHPANEQMMSRQTIMCIVEVNTHADGRISLKPDWREIEAYEVGKA
jgi:hypothetical protein